MAAAFEERARVVRGLGVALVGGESGDARPQAAMNVILQAGARMVAREVHGAGRDAEMFVNEVHDAVRQAMREVRAEVERAVFAQAARDVDARIFLEGGEADVGIGLVVAQQDVELGLVSA